MSGAVLLSGPVGESLDRQESPEEAAERKARVGGVELLGLQDLHHRPEGSDSTPQWEGSPGHAEEGGIPKIVRRSNILRSIQRSYQALSSDLLTRNLPYYYYYAGFLLDFTTSLLRILAQYPSNNI